MTVDQIAKEITDEILAEEAARERVRLNPDAPKGSDVDLIRLLLSSLDNANAALREYEAEAIAAGHTE